MSEAPSIDVVIPTRGRPGRLAKLLDDLAKQTRTPAHVFVVDDSEETPAPSRAPPGLAVTRIRPRARSYISAAKNLGWTAGRSELVAFVDDDNRLPVELLARLADDLATRPDWGAVQPGVVYRARPDLVWVYATPFRPDRWGFELLGRNRPRDPALEGRFWPTDALPNLSLVRRRVLEQVGGFDEQLPVNSSADFCQRMKRLGWAAMTDPTVLTHHDVEPPGRAGYWAEHALADVDRARLEVADWFRFHRRWTARGRWFAVRAGYHALEFLVPNAVAALVRPAGHPVAHLRADFAGLKEGLVGPLGPSPRVSRSPASEV